MNWLQTYRGRVLILDGQELHLYAMIPSLQIRLSQQKKLKGDLLLCLISSDQRFKKVV
jgi:hypothetical protein